MKIKTFLFGILIFISCARKEDDSVSPKPRMYPRIDFPDHQFITLDKTRDCGFSFRRSAHSEVIERDRFFGEELENNCWFDLNYPAFNATVHFTYHPIRENRSEEHTSELQSRGHLVCRLLLEKKKEKTRMES